MQVLPLLTPTITEDEFMGNREEKKNYHESNHAMNRVCASRKAGTEARDLRVKLLDL